MPLSSWSSLTLWRQFKKFQKRRSAIQDRQQYFIYSISFLKVHDMAHHVGQPAWQQSAGPWFLWVVRCGKLIPQWSQDCLESCCVWSLSGHFNISPRPWVSPHVAPAITGGSPSSFFLPPSAALPHSAAAASLLCKRWPLTFFFFFFHFLFCFSITL